MLATTRFENLQPDWNAVTLRVPWGGAGDTSQTMIEHYDTGGYRAGNATTTGLVAERSIASLGWTAAEALETYLRLRTFAEDWDAPGMEVYDDL